MRCNIRVSVITPVYNGAGHIRDTIESVLGQTYKNIEYIVVDGGSTDGTMEIVKEYEPLFQGRMKYVSEKDKGIYNAMNKGIRMSCGQLIGIINSDDYYDKNAVQNILDNMGNVKYQVVYGYLGMLKGNQYYGMSKKTHNSLETVMLPHPTCFVTRAVYQKYGLYLEWLKASADYELMLRLRSKKDVAFIQVKTVIAYFREGGISSSSRCYLEGEIVRVMYQIITPWEFGKRILRFIKQRFMGWLLDDKETAHKV